LVKYYTKLDHLHRITSKADNGKINVIQRLQSVQTQNLTKLTAYMYAILMYNVSYCSMVHRVLLYYYLLDMHCY